MSNFNTVTIDKLFTNIDDIKTVKIYSLIEDFFRRGINKVDISERENFKKNILELIEGNYNVYSFKVFNYYLGNLLKDLKKIDNLNNSKLNLQIKDINTYFGEITDIMIRLLKQIDILIQTKALQPTANNLKSEKNLLVYTIINFCTYIYRYEKLSQKMGDYIILESTINFNVKQYFTNSIEYIQGK